MRVHASAHAYLQGPVEARGFSSLGFEVTDGYEPHDSGAGN